MDTKLDIERAISYAFKDPKWIEKIGIAALLTLSILGIPAVYGWVMKIQQRVIDGTETDTLPEWNNLGDDYIEGLKLLGVYLLWEIPTWIIYIFIFMVMFGLIFFAAWIDLSEEAMIILFYMALLPLQAVFVLVKALIVAIRPMTTGLYLERNNMLDAFKLKQSAKLFFANFWIVIAVVFLGYIIEHFLHLLGMVFFFVALAITFPLTLLLTHHLYGQAYRISKIKLKEKDLATG